MFAYHKNKLDKKSSWCIDCIKNKVKEYRKTKKWKEWYDNYYLNNKKKLKIKSREYNITDKAKNYKKEYKIKYPLKYKASKKMEYAVYSHKILKPNICSNCKKEYKKTAIHGHHFDYNKPLEVIWLCCKCHLELHTKTFCK